ncbi:MAG: STAS/SEC14 domain-containing protein [Woeseia sp.]
MLTRIMELPDNVVGFQASGKVTAKDYQTVLVPELETTLRQHHKVRLLYALCSDFDGFSSAAAWEDTKVGLKHLAQFERIAVVTDVDWIRNSVKVFGFALPGEVRLFENDKLDFAKAWLSETDAKGKLEFEFREKRGVLILQPDGELDAADFSRIAHEIDPYVELMGKLRGVMIIAKHFPGWEDLSALAAHFRFVKDHRRKVKRLALVSDDKLMSTMPFLARHFLVEEASHFPMKKKNEALIWLSQD